jgi:diguanylate cyclase (GGDEF)-like protein/putative nucleotidyltransferase with HDIG domain
MAGTLVGRLEELPPSADVDRIVSAPPAIPAGEAGTLSSLRALLDVAAVVRSRADLQRLFEEIASTVAQALGFLAVVVNVYRPAWDDYEVVVVEGDDAAAREALLGEHVDPAQLARLLDERFRRHDAYLVPHDQFDFESTGMTWVTGTAGAPGPDAWHPDDALLVPLIASDGRPLAFLSLDDPVDGRRPGDGALEVVSAVAAIAAGVIEHAQLAAEAARHRAAVEHLLRVSSELTTSKSRAEMLDAVCEGIRDALGFEKAAVFLDEAGDGRLVLSAGVGFDDDVDGIGPFPGAALEAMMAPDYEQEGCVLIDSPTAHAMAAELGIPTVYASHHNGRGPRAWNHHWLMVPLRNREGSLLGFLWADDPVDLLLPGVDGLRALRAFANHAIGAIESARHLERMRQLAELDPLTGLRNRRGFEQGLESRRAPLALLICDLDHFKRVNDTLGHPVGDDVLRTFSDLLRDCTRENDVAVRLGGEEFALVLSAVGEREALAVAERLRREVAATFRDFPVPISVSVGIADATRDDGAEALVRAANRALYAAKRLGRDRCVVHHAETLAMLDALADDRAGEQLAAAMLLAETLDLRDVATARHSETVGRYAERIAHELQLSPDHVERVRVAGVLHDIGKLGISDAVLLKPDRLEPHEWQEIERHPELGARILEHANLRDVASWVLSHHERLDGTGYPRELAGTSIPLEGRILAVADAYEAMTADRPYRTALAETEAREELRRGAGTQFDPAVVAAFERVLDAR